MNIPVGEVKCSGNTSNPINPERVKFWKSEFAAKRDVPPIEVDTEMNLVDGRHRLTAAEELGHKTIAVVLHVASLMDLPRNKEMSAAIGAASREAISRVKFVDRREAQFNSM